MWKNYLTIQGWMIEDLHLSGNDLLVYALIYGFSQDGVSYFRGSFKYISQWLNIDCSTAIRVINRLIKCGLIEKKQEVINGIFVNFYKSCENCEKRDKTSITLLKDNYNTCNSDVIVSENKKEEEKEKNKEKEIEKDFNIFWEAYTPVKATDGYVVAKGSKKVSFEKYVRIIKSGTKPDDILQGLKNYISFCQRNNRLTCGVPVFLNQERWKDEYNTTTVIGQAAPLKMSLKEIKETENRIKLQKMLNGEL